MIEFLKLKLNSTTKKNLFFILIVILLELIIYRDFIFGKFIWAFKDLGDDSFHGVYYDYELIIRTLKQGQIPNYSFSVGMGANIYPFWFDPISIGILYFFFSNNVAEGLIWVHLAHTLIAALLFYAFLNSLRFSFTTKVIGALLFAFSGYMILGSSWVLSQFPKEVTQIAFLLFSLEQFLSYKKWHYYPLAICYIAMYQPFNIYFAALLTLLYLILKTHEMQLKFLTYKSVSLVFLGILGIGLASTWFLSSLNHIFNSARGSGEYALTQQLANQSFFSIDIQIIKTAILHLFSTNIEGSALNYAGWNNYFEAPNLYCGLISMILIPQLFHFLDKKGRIIYASILIFFALAFIFPYFRFVLWLFTGNYFRILSLLFISILLIFSMKSLNFILNGHSINLNTLLFTFLVLVSILFLLTPKEIEIMPKPIIIILFLTAFSVLLYLLSKSPNSQFFSNLLCVFIFFELILFSTPSLSERKNVTTDDIYGKRGLNDGTSTIVNSLKQNDNSFFRLEKDYISASSRNISYNDSKLQNFYGTKSYNSFHSIHFIKFLKNLELIKFEGEAGTRWVNGLMESPLAMKLCALKYILSKKSDFNKEFYDSKLIFNQFNIDVYQINNCLPLGVTFDTYISESNFNKLTYSQKHSSLLQAITVEDRILPEMKFFKETKQIDTSFQKIQERTNVLKKDTLTFSKIDETIFEGTIRLTHKKILFLAIPYDNNWHLNVNGKNHKIIKTYFGLMGVILDNGNNKIELVYKDIYRQIGFYVSLFSFIIWSFGIYFLITNETK